MAFITTCVRIHVTRWSERRGDVNDVIYDAKGLSEGRNWCTGGPMWVHARADIGSCERAVMGLESRAVSVRVIKYLVTVFSKTCNKS